MRAAEFGSDRVNVHLCFALRAAKRITYSCAANASASTEAMVGTVTSYRRIHNLSTRHSTH